MAMSHEPQLLTPQHHSTSDALVMTSLCHRLPQRHILGGALVTAMASSLYYFRTREDRVHSSQLFSSDASSRHCHQQMRNSAEYQAFVFQWMRPSVARCVSQEMSGHNNTVSSSQTPPPVGQIRRFLAWSGVVSWPIPRVITPGDAVFDNAKIRRKLKERRRDEKKLLNIQKKAMELRQRHEGANTVTSTTESQQQELNALFLEMCRIAYGKNVSPQQRENFMIRYGCAGWTNDILDSLLELGRNRGIVEFGSGHGQWARAIVDHHTEQQQRQKQRTYNDQFEIVLAFDNMDQLPLSTKIYHDHTQPAKDFFYSKVKKISDFKQTLQQPSCRGRVLLLVYPPPGPMALDIIQRYVSVAEENDTVVYVGEGRGGANGNDTLFDYLESGGWILRQVLPVNPSPGNKGFEQYHVFQRVKKQESS